MTNGSGRLAGRVAIVTSAAWGIGKGAARVFAATGARVVIAVDFGPQGVRCNAICPGWIVAEREEEHVRQVPALLSDGMLACPLRRPGRPRNIGQAALFLASDESSFITGQALVGDGGLTAQLQDSLVPVFRDDYLGRAATE